MWHPIKITEKDYFFKCTSDASSVSYYLYDLKEVWFEQCNISEVIQKAKDLNKRISYDDETVRKTIESSTPTSSSIKAGEVGRVLLLKYHLAGRPFNFSWKLKALPIEDFQKLVTYPLFMSIHFLSEQIRELKDTIRKKDIEIEQYKIEGAELKRTTVATITFNEEAFNRRFARINEASKGFLAISEKLRPTFPTVDVNDNTTGESAKPTGSTTSFISNEKLKRSPTKSRKRKFFEARRQRMEDILKSKKETMEFQSSQSQSQTPPNDDLTEILQSLDELNAKRLTSTTF